MVGSWNFKFSSIPTQNLSLYTYYTPHKINESIYLSCGLAFTIKLIRVMKVKRYMYLAIYVGWGDSDDSDYFLDLWVHCRYKNVLELMSRWYASAFYWSPMSISNWVLYIIIRHFKIWTTNLEKLRKKNEQKTWFKNLQFWNYIKNDKEK